MHNSKAQLDTLQRPKLLIRAARAAIGEFRWGRDMKMLKVSADNQNPQQLFDSLMDEEHRLNEERIEADAAYNVRKHIRILTALMVVAGNSMPRQQAA